MFLLPPPAPHQPTARTLNAITPLSDRETRRARHLRQAERLAEMAMNLAEAAHAQALRDAKPPPDLRPPPGVPGWMPPPTRAAYDSTLASNFFQEFSRCARQAILLEARLDSGAYDNAPALPNFCEPASHPSETHAPARPRQPSDETRLHHERLEHDFCARLTGHPEHALQTIAEDLDAAIAESRAAGLDLCPRNTPASPPPRATSTQAPIEKPEPAGSAPPPRPTTRPASPPAQARPRASPA